jgi:hypothetical protein
MPAWLQTFAALSTPPDLAVHETDSDDDAPATLFAEPEPVEQLADEDVPVMAWLDQADQDTEIFQNDSPDPIGAAFLIGEEDLPEWLRAIPLEESDSGSRSTAAADVAHQTPISEASVSVQIPRVTRAWIAFRDLHSLSDGGNAFALVASRGAVATIADSSIGAGLFPGQVGKAAAGRTVEYGVAAPPGIEETPSEPVPSVDNLLRMPQAEATIQATPRGLLLPVLVGGLFVLVLLLILNLLVL